MEKFYEWLILLRLSLLIILKSTGFTLPASIDLRDPSERELRLDAAPSVVRNLGSWLLEQTLLGLEDTPSDSLLLLCSLSLVVLNDTVSGFKTTRLENKRKIFTILQAYALMLTSHAHDFKISEKYKKSSSLWAYRKWKSPMSIFLASCTTVDKPL